MELKEFINEVLRQIVDGVKSAQVHASQHGAVINPANMSYQEHGEWSNFPGGMPQDVEFDVGLTAVGKQGTSEGVGVFLGSINLGKKNESGSEHTSVSRVRFTVPIVLPLSEQK